MYSTLPCHVYKCVKFLKTKAVVSLKFVNVFSRNFGIWQRFGYSTDPEDFRFYKGCLRKLWKAECIQLCLAMHLNALNFRRVKPSYLLNSSMYFREILEFCSTCVPLQTLKISDSKGDAFRRYARLNVFNFTLACQVFKCIKFLNIRSFVSLKFINVFLRNSGIQQHLGPSTEPENFRFYRGCPPMLWKAECIQLYLAMYINALNF